MAVCSLHRSIREKAPVSGAFFLWITLSGALSAAPPHCLESELPLEEYRVESIFDGDTVALEGGERVRLIGLNTTERGKTGDPDQPFAQEATSRLVQLLGSPPRIRLRRGEQEHDHYRRRLAYGFTPNGESIASILITEGLAYAVTIPPNLWNSDCHHRQQDQARVAGRGIWGEPDWATKDVAAIKAGGFQRIRGRVQQVDSSREWFWLDLPAGVSAQIARSDLPEFRQRFDLEQLGGQVITLQGWLVPRKKGYRVRLHHPSALELR